MTKPQPWKKVEELYHAALEREPGERAAFLEEACGEDGALLDEVKSLLAADERADRFIQEPAADAATQAVSEDEARSWLGRRIRDYEIKSLIGAGGMGEVYRAKDTKLDREVALKVLPRAFAQDPERVSRFQREARLLAALNHPNVAAIHGLEESEDRQVLVLELVEGETLADRITRGPIPLAEALPLFRQIAAGLEAAHEKGIVHRDLKPANVTITPEGQVKVLDFGLAKTFRGVAAADSDLDTGTTSDSQTAEGRILGTVSYMSPEQARGQPVDKRTDVWAFGCVLYEALTGRRAFAGATMSDTLAAVLDRDVDWGALRDDTPALLRSLLRRCLQKDRDRRLHDIADARIEIEEVLSEPVTSAPPAEAVVLTRPQWRQAAARAVTVLLAIIAAVAVWGPWRGAPLRPTSERVAFTIDVPPEHQLHSGMIQIALSPDGARLAFAAERSGRTQIFLRELGELEARPLPGTEGGWAPFFSPDGEWVGFFAEDGTLQKVEVTGVAPVMICDPQARSPNTGASWGPDDTIVYSRRGQEGGLWRVSAGGGTPEKLGLGRFPQILPDGKSVLFSVNLRTGGGYYRPAALSLETGETRTLERGHLGARYVGSGHLVYAEAGSLMAVRFDPSRAELRGFPEPVLENVYAHPHEMASIGVSESGTLAYVPGRYETTLEWVDREGRTTPWLTQEGTFMSPRLSPDGKQLAVVRMEPGSRFDIWVYDVERGTRHRLTHEGVYRGPVWTPDGTHITFGTTTELRWRRADGSGEAEALLPGVSAPLLSPSSWSSDGRILALRTKTTEGGSNDIWVLPLEGKPSPVIATSANELTPRFSPDSRWLAYVSDESGRAEVYLQPYPGPGERRTISNDGGTRPVWSPDGRELFYRDTSARMMAVSFGGDPTVRVGKPRVLFEGDYELPYDIAPDGQRFLMIKEAPVRSVNVLLNWFEELNRLVPEGD